MKALLIHVGADKTDWFTLRVNAPVFYDGSFEFIPVVEFTINGFYIAKRNGRYVVESRGKGEEEEVWTSERRTYSTIPARNKQFGQTLADYLPHDYDNVVAHFDPDFDNFTYGDRTDTQKGQQIWKLEPNDYIFFVAGLAPFIKEAYEVRTAEYISRFQKGQMAKYIIGYFKVQEVYQGIRAYDDTTPLLYSQATPEGDDVSDKVASSTMERIKQNAHSKRNDDIYFIVVGDRDESAFLTNVLRLTEKGSPFRPSDVGLEIYGNVNYPRGVKWMYDAKRVDKLLSFIARKL